MTTHLPRMTRRSLTGAALALPMVVGLAACAGSEDEDSSGGETSGDGSSQTRTVSTDQGSVEIPTDPKRVVLLNYALAGYLYDLDVPISQMTPEESDTDGEPSQFWAEDFEQQGTEFIPWSSAGFDLEAILGLAPDLIVAGGIGFPLFQALEVYDQLAKIAPTVVVSGSLTTWQDQFKFLADDVFDRPEVYDDALATYDARQQEVRQAITVPEGESAFLSITADERPYVLIEDQGLPTTFAALGFRPAPLFATGKFKPYTEGGDSFELSPELVGQYLDQQSIFVVGFNGAPLDVAKLAENPVYAALPAFKSGQAYDLPYYVYRGDYDEALALLDVIEKRFSTT